MKKKDKIVLACNIAVRVFGITGTIECFSGYPLIGGISAILSGVAFEIKDSVSKKQNPDVTPG